MKLSSADHPSSLLEWNASGCIQNDIESDLQDESDKIITDSQPQRGDQRSNAGISNFFINTSLDEEIKQNQESSLEVMTFSI